MKAVFVFIVLFGFGMIACQSGNDLGVQLMSGDGQDLGKFTKGEKIVIPGMLSDCSHGTSLMCAVNLSPLSLVLEPSFGDTTSTQEFTISILSDNPFLMEGENKLTLIRLDNGRKTESTMSFVIE